MGVSNGYFHILYWLVDIIERALGGVKRIWFLAAKPVNSTLRGFKTTSGVT